MTGAAPVLSIVDGAGANAGETASHAAAPPDPRGVHVTNAFPSERIIP